MVMNYDRVSIGQGKRIKIKNEPFIHFITTLQKLLACACPAFAGRQAQAGGLRPRCTAPFSPYLGPLPQISHAKAWERTK
jgi:hypothetical protein